jgi:hypothetical protein
MGVGGRGTPSHHVGKKNHQKYAYIIKILSL